ncbi:uncharacterized protein LOC105702428 [Orussus abietinus]|uniref:uncharacterized protein LOC105702428 n=1 Tax=Orussus abietinus TaxID=222816 RepID=UPI000C7162D4|nr:uncharacterized protein LOC105702428 [Orussus abietinus]
MLPSPPPPPPPPPPPSQPGRLPALRIDVAQEPGGAGATGRGQPRYEPPAAIQNAMLTKDKKPFTYTPGMGGKLDLSQIRSPRMARRVAKNAVDEGVEGPVAVPVPPAVEAPRAVSRVEVKIAPPVARPASPQSPSSPLQVTLAKAPTPWLQKRSKAAADDVPEWARRASGAAAPGQRSQPLERIIPVQIEDRPSVFAGRRPSEEPEEPEQEPDPGRYPARGVQRAAPECQPPRPSGQRASSYSDRLVPDREDGARFRTASGAESEARLRSPAARVNLDVPESRALLANASKVPVAGLAHESVPLQPVQSRAFKVLQKITDTQNDVDPTTLRKLQLTEDDKYLMEKFKEQVDGDTYLHRVTDPRYRGSAIPSRAFQCLQNMTESAHVLAPSIGSKPPSSQKNKTDRNSATFEENQVKIPANEQQVQEPRKYMGSSIPSRSFRILQAMTASEGTDTDRSKSAYN